MNNVFKTFVILAACTLFFVPLSVYGQAGFQQIEPLSEDSDSVFRFLDDDPSAQDLINVGADQPQGPAELREGTVDIEDPLNLGLRSRLNEPIGGGSQAIAAVSARLGRLLNTMFGLIGVLAIVPIVFGGLQLITSQGSQEKVAKGKKALFWGVVGVLIAFSGIVFFNFLLQVLVQR